MRYLITGVAATLLFACGGGGAAPITFAPEDDSTTTTGAGGDGGAAATSTGSGAIPTTGAGGGGDVDFPEDDFSDEDATVDDDLDATITGPTMLTEQGGGLLGITDDDRIVYRTSNGVFTIKAAPGAPPRHAALASGNVHVRGRTVFNFANVDWGTGTGILTFWTPEIGRRTVGAALIGDNRIAARDDDAYVMFAQNPTDDAFDVIISSADAEEASVLVAGVARGDLETCSPNFGFAGEAAVVSWCTQGTTEATLARFVNVGGEWQEEIVSNRARGVWSSDATGEMLFYVDAAGDGFVTDMSAEQKVGSSVAWGMMHPLGELVFFSVGDQLRRSNMSGSAIPIVVSGFSSAVDWNADLSMVLYSSQIDHENGSKRDLRVTTTDWFNPAPRTLVSQPVATLTRSALTSDGLHALYLTDVGDAGGTLNLRVLNAATPPRTLPGVTAALAAGGGLVLFADNGSAPGIFPATADLRAVDANTDAPPRLLQAGVLGGSDMQVTADGTRVAYHWAATAGGGVWIRPVE